LSIEPTNPTQENEGPSNFAVAHCRPALETYWGSNLPWTAGAPQHCRPGL